MPISSTSRIYANLFSEKGKKIAVLIDPDKHNENSLTELINLADESKIDFFLIGGSLLLNPINETISKIKQQTSTPLILFPGNLLQLTDKVDAMLLLSLISGRNPELLIGNHVIAAPLIKNTGIQTISTGYMLIGTGNTTSVEYISNTNPIPANKTDIALATAIAGELLGMQLIYMDAGSGADYPILADMIKTVKANISIPLVIGGGIRTNEQVKTTCEAGADIVVIGNVLENNNNYKISEFASIVHGL